MLSWSRFGNLWQKLVTPWKITSRTCIPGKMKKCFQQHQLNLGEINQEAIQIYPDKKSQLPTSLCATECSMMICDDGHIT